MGGRGGTSGIRNISNSAINARAKEIEIETYYRRSGSYGSHYGDSVYEAKAGPDGEIVFDYARASFKDRSSRANTQEVTFKIRNGAVQHFNNGNTTFYGINWDNVKSVSGATYDFKNSIKEKGFHWDGKLKKWVRN
jgi:hypothetical protein